PVPLTGLAPLRRCFARKSTPPRKRGEVEETAPPAYHLNGLSSLDSSCARASLNENKQIHGEEQMSHRNIVAVALTALVATPLAAEPITLKLNSPAPPWSYLNKEVITPWAEPGTARSD